MSCEGSGVAEALEGGIHKAGVAKIGEADAACGGCDGGGASTILFME